MLIKLDLHSLFLKFIASICPEILCGDAQGTKGWLFDGILQIG